jgi:hypothetical protein
MTNRRILRLAPFASVPVSRALLLAVMLPGAAANTFAATLAYWRMEGDGVNTPVAGSTRVLDTNARVTTNTSPGIVIVDVSGNGNTVWAWDHSCAGHIYQSSVPAATVPATGAMNRFSIQNAGSYPCCFTWSKYSRPAVDLETVRPLAWTIEASIRPTTIDSSHRTFIGRDGNGVATTDANLAPLYFQTTPGGYVRIEFTDAGGRTYSVSDGAALVANAWYNVAAVSDGSMLRLYKDSGAGYVLVGSTLLTAGDTRLAYDTAGSTTAGDTQWGWTLGRGRYGTSDLQADNHTDRGALAGVNNFVTAPLSSVSNVLSYIGRSLYSGDAYFNVTLDEFRIYDGALQPEDVAAAQVIGPNALLTPAVSLSATLSGGDLILTWPVAGSGFTLESSPTLGEDALWTPVPATPSVIGVSNRVSISPTDTALFFRLRR